MKANLAATILSLVILGDSGAAERSTGRFSEAGAGNPVATAHAVSAAQPVGNAVDPVFYYFDEAKFLAETGANDLSGALPGSTSSTSAQTVGGVEFVSHPPSTLNFSDWSAGLPDSFELALDGDQELNIVPESAVLAIGFQIEEAGSSHPNLNAEFRDSLFTVTLCSVRFSRGSECPAPAIISVREFSPPDSNPPLYTPSFFGVWANEWIEQISIRETTLLTGDGNEFFGRVFASSAARSQPKLDQFESDPTPETAKSLFQSIASIVPRVGYPIRYIQDRSFHINGDNDWIYYDSGRDRDFQLNLTSNNPEFHPVVELYPSERFGDSGAPPVAVYGNCSGPPGDLMVDVDDYAAGRYVLVRVRNCILTGAPMRYQYEFQVTDSYQAGFDNPARLSGQVLIAGSLAPAGAFIQSNNGEVTFSNPVTGNYFMALTPNREHVMTIYSPELDQLQITIPAPFPLQNIQQDFIVGSDGGVVFVNGFE